MSDTETSGVVVPATDIGPDMWRLDPGHCCDPWWFGLRRHDRDCRTQDRSSFPVGGPVRMERGGDRD
jgi:hypothetical protein